MEKLSCISYSKGFAWTYLVHVCDNIKAKRILKRHSYQKPYNFTIVSWCWGTETLIKLNMVTKTGIPFKPLEIWNFSFTPTYLNNVLNIQRAPYSESRSSSLLYGLCHDCTPLTHWCADSESGHSRPVTFSRHLFPCHETSPLVFTCFLLSLLSLSVSSLSSTLEHGL